MDENYNYKRVLSSALHASLGSFIFGYNVGVFTSVQPCVSSSLGWGSSESSLIPLMTAIMYMGGFMGALLSGALKRFGRRKSIMLADWINIIGVCIIVIPHTISFGIGRFITGFSSGMFCSLCPLYVNERTPPQISGKIGAIIQASSCLGVVFAYGLALPLPTGDYSNNPFTYWWIGMFAFQAPVALLQFYLFKTTHRLDTPASLMDRGLEEKAMRSLLEVYNQDYAHSLIQGLNGSILGSPESPAANRQNFEYKELLCCKKGTTKMMRLGVMTCVIQEMCGIIPILSYTTSIFSSFGGGVFVSRLLTFVSGVVKMGSVMSVLPFIDKWGRRPIYIIGPLAMAAFLFLIGVFSELVEVFYIIPFLCIEGFLIAFEGSVGPVCWLYCGEIMSPKGMSIAIAVNWLCIIITVFTFPYLVDAFGKGVTFWIYAGINLMSAGYAYFEFIETKGMDKKQIQDILAGQQGQFSCKTVE